MSLELKWEEELKQVGIQNTDIGSEVQRFNNVADNASKVQFEGSTFELLGIFKVSSEPFILLRSSSDGLLKLSENEHLTERVYVKQISSDAAVFFDENQMVAELKLFKWQRNNEAVE
ncbi:hypothetical protein NI389_07455 [Pseudoalteromonas xiamenensis]|uniref:hypothetical protein n=1 Tax=Pseudoalteromonas xiamenensis TaxID=882626 RepID=UPI0027E3C780|nr:hypothetical protein [Pseudoalteromonas xiamenensis]WMN61209.1 hypothetical protein NI389_07455 [Pseudoalteromonas xiamenensis]